jgi:putative methyltransferase (TIGR04325 family)
MRDFVRQLVPPILMKVLKPAFAPRTFNSYEEAITACRNSAYEEEDLVKVVVEKNLIFRQTIRDSAVFDLSALRTAIALGLTNGESTLRVLDFGGGGGYHYTLAKAVLGNSRSLKWNVVETSIMVKEAQRIADSDLRFYDNINDAKKNLGSVDLVFTSSALQYCPNPVGCLRELTEVGATNIFITRTPFNQADNSLVSIQVSKLSENGPGALPVGFDDRNVSYPITFASRHEVEKVLRERYEIRFSINEDRGTFVAGKNTVDMYGYFGARR